MIDDTIKIYIELKKRYTFLINKYIYNLYFTILREV